MANRSPANRFGQYASELILHFLAHLKTEYESPARQPEPELPGCTTEALNADRNMVGGPRTEILRRPLDGHIELQSPSAPPLQPVTQEPIVSHKNTGGAYAI